MTDSQPEKPWTNLVPDSSGPKWRIEDSTQPEISNEPIFVETNISEKYPEISKRYVTSKSRFNIRYVTYRIVIKNQIFDGKSKFWSTINFLVENQNCSKKI